MMSQWDNGFALHYSWHRLSSTWKLLVCGDISSMNWAVGFTFNWELLFQKWEVGFYSWANSEALWPPQSWGSHLCPSWLFIAFFFSSWVAEVVEQGKNLSKGNDSWFSSCSWWACFFFRSLAVGSKSGYKFFSLSSVDKLEQIYECSEYLPFFILSVGLIWEE